MELTVLGSSSKGNCYVLQNENEALVIEAGIHLREVKKVVNYDLSKLKGCVMSHVHNDHAGFASDYCKAGIPILALQDVIEKKKLDRNAYSIIPNKGYKLGGFKIMPFRVMHDVPCVGYLIEHADCGRILFATDTYVVGHRQENGEMHHATFANINHWLIEANYTTWIVDRNIKNGNLNVAMKNRLLTSHLSLGNAIKTLQRHDLSQTKEIVLIHLSDGNSDEKLFVQKVRNATGKRVVIAKPYLTINLKENI